MTPLRIDRGLIARLAGTTACAVLLTFTGCEKDETGDDGAMPGSTTGMTPPASESSSSSSSSSSSDGADSSSGEPGTTGAACGPAQLCARTINECEIELTQDQCEGWYADPAQNMCYDIEGYTACNCNCVEEPTCDEYFACGMTCFEDFC
ncbi:MAG: hypothetical protein K0V04_37035 [Deltaproteobacteria bacterium]|nr:hypothetical protein [Deltaproteobacteria bacterium]